MTWRIKRAFGWIEPRARNLLSSWTLWLGAAYFGLVLTFVLTISSFQKINEQETLLIARENAQNSALVSDCYQQYVEAPAVRRFIEAQIIIAENQRNALEVNLLTLPDDPRVEGPKGWRVSLRKIEATLDDLQAFLRESRSSTPTRKKCDEMADRLHVPRQNVRNR